MYVPAFQGCHRGLRAHASPNVLAAQHITLACFLARALWALQLATYSQYYVTVLVSVSWSAILQVLWRILH